MMALADMFAGLGRGMDPSLDDLVPGLLKRAGDTNLFIASASESALASMVLNCGEPKVLSSLLIAAAHKNPTIRLKASPWLDRAVAKSLPRLANAPRDIERVVAMAVKYLSEGAPEARHAGQRCLSRLLGRRIIDEKYLIRVLPDKTWGRVKPVLDRGPPPPDPFDLEAAVQAVVIGPQTEKGRGEATFEAPKPTAKPLSRTLSDGRNADVMQVESTSRRSAPLNPALAAKRRLGDRGVATLPPASDSPVAQPGEEATHTMSPYAIPLTSVSGRSIQQYGSSSAAVGNGPAAVNNASSPLVPSRLRPQMHARSRNDVETPDSARPYSPMAPGANAATAALAMSPYAEPPARQAQRERGDGSALPATPPTNPQGQSLGPTPQQLQAQQQQRPYSSSADDELQGVLLGLNSQDWREKVRGLGELSRMSTRYRETLASNILRIADTLVNKMNDGNAKVSLAALQAVGHIIPVIRSEAGEKLLPVLLPPLCTLSASTSRPIAESAMASTDHFLHSFDPAALMMPLANLVKTAANARIRVLILEKVAPLIPDAFARRPASVNRWMLPTALSLLDETKSDIKSAVSAVLLRVSACIGPEAIVEVAQTTPGISDIAIERLRKTLNFPPSSRR
jgi:hypothetical protein